MFELYLIYFCDGIIEYFFSIVRFFFDQFDFLGTGWEFQVFSFQFDDLLIYLGEYWFVFFFFRNIKCQVINVKKNYQLFVKFELYIKFCILFICFDEISNKFLFIFL